MKTFESSIEIAASPQAAFDLTQDYSRRLSWDPFLSEARLVGGATEAGVGVRAWCVAKVPPVGMETEYVSFQPPRVAAVKMTRGPWFFESFAGSWRFDEVSPGVTRVTFRYSLTTRPAALRPVAAAVFNREMRQRLEGLKATLER